MTTATVSRAPSWIGAAAPLLLIALLVAGFVALDPISSLRTSAPLEEIAFERVVLTDDHVEMHLRNDGPDPVTIAQVMVNDAFSPFAIEDPTLSRLEAETLELDYPWEAGLPLRVSLVTSTGAVLEHNIDAAAPSPVVNAEALLTYALLGLFIGVIPIAVGLLWFPALRRAGARWVTFFLALTVGLLVFLLVDTVSEGLDLAAAAAAALHGLSLFAIGAIGAVTALAVLERRLGPGRERAGGGGLALAYLVALGIGLHNLGEGLAVGAALASGEAALGTFLVVGFALHNTTEGLAIVAPLGAAAHRPRLLHFVALGAIAGLPAVLGAWAGGFAFSAALAALAFGVAAGAIAQVVWQVARGMDRGRALASGFGAAGFVTGLVVMYGTGLVAG